VTSIAALPKLEDLAMTTNAYFLSDKAQMLKEAGLSRLTISLDSLKPDRFAQITGSNSFTKVMDGIKAAEKAGYTTLKFNTVIIRGVNDDEILDFARFSRETGHIVRFIEFMPLDEDKKWSWDRMVSREDLLKTLGALGPIEGIKANYPSETASRFRYLDGKGEIGIIASITNPFCDQCSRLRLTADGKMRTCLFAHEDHDLLAFMRGGASQEELRDYIRKVTLSKGPGHSISHEQGIPDYPNRSMSLIGG